MMNGTGSVPLYALGKAIDFQDLDHLHSYHDILNVFPSSSNSDPITTRPSSLSGGHQPVDILMLGVSDISSVLKTIAQSRRYRPAQQIHFHIFESQATAIAKQILLLLIALDPSLDHLTYEERAELFLEFYGSTKIRDKSHVWLLETVNTLIRIVTDSQGIVSTLLNLKQLRFRDLDDIESVFKFWKSSVPFPIDLFWDNRLRQHYQTRYDVKENVIDWDFHMRLHELNPNLTKQEFQTWRLAGTSFQVRQIAQTSINKTMATASMLKSPTDHCQTSKYGYFSDTVSGPFTAWGSDSENKSRLTQTANGERVCNATHISLTNVSMVLSELHANLTSGDLKTFLGSFRIHYYSPKDFDSLTKLSHRVFDLALLGSLVSVPLLPRLLTTVSVKTYLIESMRWNLDLSKAQACLYCEHLYKTFGSKYGLSHEQANVLKHANCMWDKGPALMWDYLIYHVSPVNNEGLDMHGGMVGPIPNSP